MVHVAPSFSILSPVLGGDCVDVTVFPFEQLHDPGFSECSEDEKPTVDLLFGLESSVGWS